MFLILIYILLGIYSLVIISFTIGWFRLKKLTYSGLSHKNKASIVVAIRNEEQNITSLIESLTNQDYPKKLTEIILVNDHSTDNTKEIIENNISTIDHIKLIELETNLSGKKEAINTGIIASKGELIITTDADCKMQNKWISTIVGYFEKHHPQLIVSPVVIQPNFNPWSQIQSLEFISLAVSTAGAIGINRPIMCNGANLAFTRQAYDQYNSTINAFTSGDDQFLMLAIKKTNRKDIHYLKSNDAIVSTKAMPSIKSFISQRIRWTSKSRGYYDTDYLFTAFTVALLNVGLLSLFIATFFNNNLIIQFLSVYLIKTTFDLILMIPFAIFMKLKRILLWFPFVQIFYPIYITLISISGNLTGFKWKNRKYKK